jgi:hypothetical protein
MHFCPVLLTRALQVRGARAASAVLLYAAPVRAAPLRGALRLRTSCQTHHRSSNVVHH